MTRKIEPLAAKGIGQRLRHAREAKGVTLKRVASQCGTHYTQVSKIERGKFAFLNKRVQTLCKYLQVDPDLPDDASPQALHARLDRLISAKPAAVVALSAMFDVFDRITN